MTCRQPARTEVTLTLRRKSASFSWSEPDLWHSNGTPTRVFPSTRSDYGPISLIFQKSTDRTPDLSPRKHSCRHLIEQILKEVVIRPINDEDLRV